MGKIHEMLTRSAIASAAPARTVHKSTRQGSTAAVQDQAAKRNQDNCEVKQDQHPQGQEQSKDQGVLAAPHEHGCEYPEQDGQERGRRASPPGTGREENGPPARHSGVDELDLHELTVHPVRFGPQLEQGQARLGR
jgi:hypothetical protein